MKGEDNMKYLEREDILNAKDITEEDFDCPKWGGSIKIKSLSLEKRQQVRLASLNAAGQLDETKLSIATFIEGVVQPKFTATDYDKLKSRDYGTMIAVLNRILEISGIGVDLKNASKATEPGAK